MKRTFKMFSGLIFLFLLGFVMQAYAAEDVPRISTEQLREMLDTPDLVVLDTRIAKDWRKSDRKIVGAVRVDPHDVSSWTGNYTKDKKIVVYCA